MSLSARERQVLDSIEEGLARSDPRLVGLLATFTRLASGEKMPAREKIAAASGRARRRFILQRPGLLPAVALIYVLVIAALVVSTTVLSHGSSHRQCPSSWTVLCASSPTAPGSRPAGQGSPDSRMLEPASPHPAPG
ncbi:MAG TPA: hypothetical protein VME44_18940 [Streptosporangiaceae bacterium]|nr:hypothetical protein [Streptosporangiaceae bacterium]